MNLLEETNNVELTLKHLEELGSSAYSNPHYPVGWANAGNTPFQWYKSWVHSGGVKDPLIVSYPKGIHAKGEIRNQYLHVIDIAPTILDILGVDKPDHIKGIAQNHIMGQVLQEHLMMQRHRMSDISSIMNRLETVESGKMDGKPSQIIFMTKII